MSSRCGVVGAFVVLMMAVAVSAMSTYEVILDANSVFVRTGSVTLLRYRHSDVAFKPYVQELSTPSGVNVLLDSPPDHLHHHGLMFACAVNGIDFWGEYAGRTGDRAADKRSALPGKQIHQGLAPGRPLPVRRGRPRPPFEDVIHWCRQGEKKPLLIERRSIITCLYGEPEATLVTWECELAVPPGKESAVLAGSHYHGLGMRFIRSMDAAGEFRNPDNDPGTVFRGEERLARSRWCAYTAQADGKTVTVAMFDDPNNPRHPATWFTMAKPFAYLSATMRLHEAPLKVLSDKPLLLRYGVALWDGRIEAPRIDALYKHWVSTEAKSVR